MILNGHVFFKTGVIQGRPSTCFVVYCLYLSSREPDTTVCLLLLLFIYSVVGTVIAERIFSSNISSV